ncbi:MAG: hypothetical protein AB7V18_01710 [Pyrinomonadaceae bacterium]
MATKAERKLNSRRPDQATPGQTGSATVIAVLVLALLLAFVALAVSRTTAETVASGNDAMETKTFEAAHASLEVMTRNFDKIFDEKLVPDPSDLTRIQGQTPPGFDAAFTFDQAIAQTGDTEVKVMTGERFQGLNSLRDEWQLDAVATDRLTGVQVALRRKFLNDRIPIFQFGIFYDDDLEFHPGPRFDFGGRVHSNGSLFLAASTGLYFSSKVTSSRHVFTDVQKNGFPYTNWGDNVYIRNASGTYVRLRNNMGSVLQNPVNGAPAVSAPLPTAYTSATWSTNQGVFQGNLLANQGTLDLPLKLNSNNNGLNLDLIEIVKRGKAVGDLWNDGTGTSSAPAIVPVTSAAADDRITASERFYNKTGIRVSLADSKAKLPGCVDGSGTAVVGPCGVRLDGDATGSGAEPAVGDARGYRPYPMTGSPSYTATRINGERFRRTGKEVWIKVETVTYNNATLAYDIKDITHDILSLGVTEPASGGMFITEAGYNSSDSRSVIKLQRFNMRGPAVVTTASTYITNSGTDNYVLAGTVTGSGNTNLCSDPTAPGFVRINNGTFPEFGPAGDNRAHWKQANVGTMAANVLKCVVPFPINVFDTREGLYNDTTSIFSPIATYSTRVPWAGVMSMVDIDVANLRNFLNGNYDSYMPTGTPFATAAGRPLRGSDVPSKNGWVFYVSDRRGDYDFDGEYDMEDIYGPNDGTLQAGEDVNRNGILDYNFFNGEAVRYTGAGSDTIPEIAALFEHKYYRRGVRLTNGTRLPGNYDSSNPTLTRGFTVASENGVYVWGNYNATGVASYGSPTPSTDYLPQNTVDHVPASIVADAVTILSNNWSDSNSFRNPFSRANRPTTETTVRFGMISGDTLTSLNGTPNQGGGDPRMNGGVHNFPRFLENWSQRLNYSGSLINLFNSRNNNGAFKCCDKVYSPPTRNWVFDATFRDINRLPPGTPFFQSIQITGFERRN